jgi:outer membrane protein TolC
MEGRRYGVSTRRWTALAAFTLAVAVPAWSETPPATPDALTLEEAVRLALQNNRGVGVAALQVARAEHRVAAAKTRRLPNLDLQATAGSTIGTIRVTYPGGAFGTFPGIGPIPAEETVVESPPSVSGNVNATLTQPLTQLHRLGLNVKSNELSRDIEKHRLRDQRAATVADVRHLYYGLLQQESVVRAKEERLRVLRELDRVVGQQVAVEAALPADGLEVKSRLAAEEYEIATVRGDLATGRERMNLLLGRDLGAAFTLVAVPETSMEEVDLPSAMTRAVERRPDLAQARLSVEQADTDRRIKNAESIPEVSLAVTYVSFVNVDLLPRSVALAGIQLKWEPFDWGRRGKEKAEKALQLEQAKSRAREAEDLARIEVAERFRKLQEARLLVEAERLGREAASERLRIVTLRHRQDAALLKDVLEAEAGVSAAHAEYDRALLTFWTARADFQKSIGEEL